MAWCTGRFLAALLRKAARQLSPEGRPPYPRGPRAPAFSGLSKNAARHADGLRPATGQLTLRVTPRHDTPRRCRVPVAQTWRFPGWCVRDASGTAAGAQSAPGEVAAAYRLAMAIAPQNRRSDRYRRRAPSASLAKVYRFRGGRNGINWADFGRELGIPCLQHMINSSGAVGQDRATAGGGRGPAPLRGPCHPPAPVTTCTVLSGFSQGNGRLTGTASVRTLLQGPAAGQNAPPSSARFRLTSRQPAPVDSRLARRTTAPHARWSEPQAPEKPPST